MTSPGARSRAGIALGAFGVAAAARAAVASWMMPLSSCHSIRMTMSMSAVLRLISSFMAPIGITTPAMVYGRFLERERVGFLHACANLVQRLVHSLRIRPCPFPSRIARLARAVVPLPVEVGPSDHPAPWTTS